MWAIDYLCFKSDFKNSIKTQNDKKKIDEEISSIHDICRVIYKYVVRRFIKK